MRLPIRRGFTATTDALRMHARARERAPPLVRDQRGRNTETRLGEANALRARENRTKKGDNAGLRERRAAPPNRGN